MYISRIFFLLKTKNSNDYVGSLKRSLGYNHFHLVNPVGLSGGLALFSRDTHELEIFHSSGRIIDAGIKT